MSLAEKKIKAILDQIDIQMLGNSFDADLQPSLSGIVHARNELIKLFTQQEVKEIVICAAIKINEATIIRGQRHSDAINTAVERGWKMKATSQAVQGFITSRNRFVDRIEAREIQRKAGIEGADKYGYFSDKELFSEDLY